MLLETIVKRMRKRLNMAPLKDDIPCEEEDGIQMGQLEEGVHVMLEHHVLSIHTPNESIVSHLVDELEQMGFQGEVRVNQRRPHHAVGSLFKEWEQRLDQTVFEPQWMLKRWRWAQSPVENFSIVTLEPLPFRIVLRNVDDYDKRTFAFESTDEFLRWVEEHQRIADEIPKVEQDVLNRLVKKWGDVLVNKSHVTKEPWYVCGTFSISPHIYQIVREECVSFLISSSREYQYLDSYEEAKEALYSFWEKPIRQKSMRLLLNGGEKHGTT